MREYAYLSESVSGSASSASGVVVVELEASVAGCAAQRALFSVGVIFLSLGQHLEHLAVASVEDVA